MDKYKCLKRLDFILNDLIQEVFCYTNNDNNYIPTPHRHSLNRIRTALGQRPTSIRPRPRPRWKSPALTSTSTSMAIGSRSEHWLYHNRWTPTSLRAPGNAQLFPQNQYVSTFIARLIRKSGGERKEKHQNFHRYIKSNSLSDSTPQLKQTS